MSAGIRAPSSQPFPGAPTAQAQDSQWENPPPPQPLFPAGKPERTRVCTCLELSLPWAGRPWVSFPPSLNGPQPAMPGQPHPQHGSAPLSLKSMLLNMGWGGGLTGTVCPVMPLTARAPSLSPWGGHPPRPLKAQQRPPAVSLQPRREGCKHLRPGRWVPPGARWGGLRVTAQRWVPPLFSAGGGDAD